MKKILQIWAIISVLAVGSGCNALHGLMGESRNQQPLPPCDSTHIIPKDSIAWHIIHKDTIDYHWISKDTIDWNIIHRDSIDWNIIPKDTIKYHWISKDTIRYHLVDRPYPPKFTLTHILIDSTKQEQLQLRFRSHQADSVRFTVQCVPAFEAHDFEIFKLPLKDGLAQATSWKRCPDVAVALARTPFGTWALQSLDVGAIRTLNDEENE